MGGHNIAGGEWEHNGMNPKPIKKLSLGAESFEEFFFTQSQVLLAFIVLKNHYSLEVHFLWNF